MVYRSDWRNQFPVTRELVYMNHAAVAPLPRVCVKAMHDWAEEAGTVGSLHYDRWMQTYEKLRVAAATLCNAHRDEIALVKNTSEGIATVALGFSWTKGDALVVFEEEFPANQYIWRKLADDYGLELRWLSIYDPLEKVEATSKGARLLAISFVNYLSGYRVDLEAIGDICRRNQLFYFVDAIQGLGAFPLDVAKCGIHALAADGHKWLLGPEGWGILYVNRAWQDRIVPVEFGWTTVAGYADYSSRDMTLRHDAGRYECGTLNTISSYGLLASAQLLLEVGIPNIASRILHLTERLLEGARCRGYEAFGPPRTPETASGIITLRKPGTDSRLVHSRLKEAKVMAAPRQGWVRFSPHFYLSDEDIDRAVEALL